MVAACASAGHAMSSGIFRRGESISFDARGQKSGASDVDQTQLHCLIFEDLRPNCGSGKDFPVVVKASK